MRVDEEGVVLGDSEGVFLRMPSTHLDFLGHVYFGGFLLAGGILILRDNFFALVGFVCSYVFASLVHELYIDLAVCLIFRIDYMDVSVIASCDNHTAIRRNL